jgi:hypothetical protein
VKDCCNDQQIPLPKNLLFSRPAKPKSEARIVSSEYLEWIVFQLGELNTTQPLEDGMNYRVVVSRWFVLLITTLVVASAGAATAQNAPATNTYFVCPTVSTNNGNGTWVVGQHGGYYVLVPKQGVNGSKVFLTIPVQVFNLAQIPAGWGLYSSLPSYPNFVGTATLLSEGIATWLDSPTGWQEGDAALVASNPDGTYSVTNLRLFQQIVIQKPIPLASGAVW